MIEPKILGNYVIVYLGLNCYVQYSRTLPLKIKIIEGEVAFVLIRAARDNTKNRIATDTLC